MQNYYFLKNLQSRLLPIALARAEIVANGYSGFDEIVALRAVVISEGNIRQAKSMLSSTSQTIQEIADRLGFQNQSHFGTFFRRYTGKNPSAYRRSDSRLVDYSENKRDEVHNQAV